MKTPASYRQEKKVTDMRRHLIQILFTGAALTVPAFSQDVNVDLDQAARVAADASLQIEESVRQSADAMKQVQSEQLKQVQKQLQQLDVQRLVDSAQIEQQLAKARIAMLEANGDLWDEPPVPPAPPAKPVPSVKPAPPMPPAAPSPKPAPFVYVQPLPPLPPVAPMIGDILTHQGDLSQTITNNINLDLAERITDKINFKFAEKQLWAMAGPEDRQAQRNRDRSDRSYRNGTRAINRKEFESAVTEFDEVINVRGDRADGAYYWKAYAQSKLGRRDAALSTLVDLQKAYPSSRWLTDAKALEVEVRQASGKGISPEAEADEDLKILAINSLMQTEPDRALPLLEKVLNDPKNSPQVRQRALFVLAQNQSPRAQEIVARMAKGSSNPDMQLKAVEVLSVSGPRNLQSLADIYHSTNDVAVKREILNGFIAANGREQLASVAKTEPNIDLRRRAIHHLGATGGTDLLGPIYDTEKDPNVKREIINALFAHGNTKQLVAVARREKDPELKKEAVKRLSMMHSQEATDYLMELLNK